MKIIPPASIEDFDRVEESFLRKRYEITKAPSLENILKMADEWREAGCTPAFVVVNEEPILIMCVAEETFGKYIN